MCRDCWHTPWSHKEKYCITSILSLQGFHLFHRWLIYLSALPIYNLGAKPCKDNPAHATRRECISKNEKSQTIIQSPLPPLAASLCQLLFMIHQEAVEWNNDISISVAPATKQMCHDNRKGSKVILFWLKAFQRLLSIILYSSSHVWGQQKQPVNAHLTNWSTIMHL